MAYDFEFHCTWHCLLGASSDCTTGSYAWHRRLLSSIIFRVRHSRGDMYTMFRKKSTSLYFGHNFGKWRPIFKIVSLTYSRKKTVQIETSISIILCCYTILWNLKVNNDRQTVTCTRKNFVLHGTWQNVTKLATAVCVCMSVSVKCSIFYTTARTRM